jgi:uncharacterized membrane protein
VETARWFHHPEQGQGDGSEDFVGGKKASNLLGLVIGLLVALAVFVFYLVILLYARRKRRGRKKSEKPSVAVSASP